MDDAMHVINRLTLDFELERALREGNDECRRLCEAYVRPALERALDGSPECNGLIFPKIEVDLGDVDEHDIARVLEQKLREALANRSAVHSASASAKTEALAKTEASASGKSYANDVDAQPVCLTKEEQMFASFVAYLEQGFTMQNILGEHFTIEELAAALDEINDHKRETLLRAMRSQAAASLRFAESVATDTLKEFALHEISAKTAAAVPHSSIIAKSINNPETVAAVALIATHAKAENVAAFAEWLIEASAPQRESALSLLAERYRRWQSGESPVYSAAALKTEAEAAIAETISLKNVPTNEIAGNESSERPQKRAETLISSAANIPFNESNESTTSEITSKAAVPAQQIFPETPSQKADLRIAVEDAGLAFLHPFFRMLFARLGLLTPDEDFLSMTERIRAAKVLKYLATGQCAMSDATLVLEKVVCGIPLAFHIAKGFQPSEKEQSEVENLLKSVLMYWNPFRDNSVANLREAFLLRQGSVEEAEKMWILRAKGKSVDVLLDTLPWGFEFIATKWSLPITVEWQKDN